MTRSGYKLLHGRGRQTKMPLFNSRDADFEALTTKVEGLDPTKSNTQRTQHHEACSYCYVVVRCDGKTEAPAQYRGPNAAEHFLRALQEEERGIQKVLAKPQDMRMTRADWESHRTASSCHVCDKPLEGDSVKDHCHITGKYRGAAHSACNLKLRLSPKTTTIPVVFHNLRGYDSHLLMQAISKVEGRMNCIPNNTEKYISFSLGQLRFIDSAQFLLASLDKLVSANKPEAFHITARYEPDCAAIEVHKSRLVLNRPVYVGMSILDLSNTLMYDFYYGQLKNQYGDRCQLLYTDTDSLLLEIQTKDVYRDMGKHAELYDTSDYPREHPLHSVENKKVVGKMTDECAGRPIAEYIGLRPKMYSILEVNGDNIKKAKGVKKYVVKKHIRHNQYREALFEKTTFHHSMNVLRSERHHIYGQHFHKVWLSPFDSKR